MTSHHLIREARRRAGLTQSELAVRAMTTQSAIARWETGRSQPSLEKLMQLVDCCGLELSFGLSARADAELELLASRRSLSPEVRLEQLVAGVSYLREVGVPGAAGAVGEPVPAPFDPRLLLATLVRHEVRFIVIGAGAAVLHGSPLLTRNLDITPARDPQTLEQLGRALLELDARPVGALGARDEADPLHVESLPAAGNCRMQTKFGMLGIVFAPTGTAGYDDLRVQAAPMSLRGTTVLVAALCDVVRSMEASGRSRDRTMLPTLRRLLQLSVAT